MTDTTTATAKTDSNEIGFGYINKDKKERDMINLTVNGRKLTAYMNTGDKKTEKSPDLRVLDFNIEGEDNIVGSGWIGETEQGREKINFKLGEDNYFLAVRRDTKEGQSEKRADYTVFGSETAAVTK